MPGVSPTLEDEPLSTTTMAIEKPALDEKDMVVDKKEVRLPDVTTDTAFLDLSAEERAIKEKALVRKVDARMMPLMMLICTSPSCSHSVYATLTFDRRAELS